MKKRLIKLFMLCALTVSVFALASCLRSDTEDLTKIKVVLLETDGVKVLSRQSVEIKPGNDVEFKIKIADSYAYLGMTKNGEAVREEAGTPEKDFPVEGEYNEKNGTLKLKNVKYPTTVEVIAKPRSELYSFELAYDERMGSVQIIDGTKLTKGYKWMPTEDGSVSLIANAYGDYSFNGWSVGDYIANGGKTVAYSKELLYAVEDNTVLYANFSTLSENQYRSVYHLNGGMLKNDGMTSYELIGEKSSQFSMQHTPISDGSFVRNGYVAVGYSAVEASFEGYESVNAIPGFCNMGGVCDASSGLVSLYVVWAKETDASFFTFSEGTVTGYSGDSAVVIIPETINGQAVTKIAAGAFKGKSVKRLVIPRSVVTVEDGVFESCKSLKEIVLFDSVVNITDDAFKGCDNISTVTLNAQRLPRYSGTLEGSFCLKYERLRTLTGKKLIVVGGNAALSGINSNKLRSRTSGYSVLNYGTDSELSQVFFLDVVSNYLESGDIVVHSPEMTAAAMGGSVMTAAMLRANEQCYDIFREVDMRNYTGFFTALGKFQTGDAEASLGAASEMPGKQYHLECAELNQYGDRINIKDITLSVSFGEATETLKTELLAYESLNRVQAKVKENGGTILMSFAPRDVQRLSTSIAVKGHYDSFTVYCEKCLHYPVISNIGKYMLEHSCFYDSEYTCNSSGSDRMTTLLVSDINEYLNTVREGKTPSAPMISDEYDIIYYANGGKTSDGEAVYRESKKYDRQFSMQQTLWSNGKFLRNGYVAVGYSTEAVSFEDFYSVNYIPKFSNMGGVCEVTRSEGSLSLYVVWAKATLSTEFEFSNGTITKYNGNAEIVVIPETIDGQAVTKIAAGAFKGKSVKRLVIPRSVVTVEDGAFESCKSLYEVVFFDSVINITDNAFKGCENISTITLNSQRLPKYSGGAEGTFCIKYERLRTLKTKKIIVLSGSSTLHGLNSATMEQSFPGYSVVNYGTNIANCSLFFLDVISNYTIEGDIVIHAPEMGTNVMGGDNYINPKLFRANEQCYDIFREVDMRDYKNFFTSFGYFQTGDPNDSSLTPAIKLTGVEYQKHCSELNEYGDYSKVKSDPRNPDPFGNANQGFNTGILSAANAARLNAVNKKIKVKGGTLLMSFAPREIQRMSSGSRTEAQYNAFTKDCEDKLDYAVISNVGTYLLDHSYFYDSEYHLNDDGAGLRTRLLTEDLKRYLDDPDSGAPML